MKKRVFGPVNSRRLGLSLGVDLTPFKTCTYNCVYCQLSATNRFTIRRDSFFDPDEVFDEILQALEDDHRPDFITFSGSGEPTLSTDLGYLIDRIKEKTGFPVCVITNSSLLWMKDVAAEVSRADLVIPSIDAATEKTWVKINCPVPEMSFVFMLDGIRRFCKSYKGRIWLEILLIAGINDHDKEVAKLAYFARGLGVEKIQLNTAERPPRRSEVKAVPHERLVEIAEKYDFGAPVEVLTRHKPKEAKRADGELTQLIVELLQRHPATLEEIAGSLGYKGREIRGAIELLLKQRRIEATDPREGEDSPFYRLVEL
jgi:wyosine [tRNA(Phe)-imidazoG37] synthetase (radical SAM superfamily)